MNIRGEFIGQRLSSVFSAKGKFNLKHNHKEETVVTRRVTQNTGFYQQVQKSSSHKMWPGL
jgi:hypothetical protein